MFESNSHIHVYNPGADNPQDAKFFINIMLTCPYNVDPFTPHFYVVKLVYRGIHYFLIFALKHGWYSLEPPDVYPQSIFEQKYKNCQKISLENCHFYSREILLYIAWECLRNDTSAITLVICCNSSFHLMTFEQFHI